MCFECVVLICLSSRSVTALKCYECRGTEDDCKKSTLEGDKAKFLSDCRSDEDKCMRSFLKKDSATYVRNSCSDELSCNQEIIGCGQYSGVTCKVSCCDADECNMGSHVSFNVFLLSTCSALGLGLALY